MRLKWKLFLASMKIFFRQQEAIIWTFLFPIFMIVLFSFVNFDGIGKVEIGVISDGVEADDKIVGALRNVEALNLNSGTREEEIAHLKRGDRDLVLVVNQPGTAGPARSVILYANEARPKESQLGHLVVRRVLDEIDLADHSEIKRTQITVESIRGRNLTYIDFLLPGVLAMSIMQMGIFGVAFGLVSLKKRGILRRLWVTPISPSDFVLAQVGMRLLVVMIQISLMIGLGLLVLDFSFAGNIGNLFILGILGAVVFLALGFAIAGISKSEDQVAPLANIISLPMILLSGVFFSRTNLPGIAHTITDFLPLTYLADGMRAIAIEGYSLAGVVPQIIGLGVWCVIACLIAVKMFRWE